VAVAGRVEGGADAYAAAIALDSLGADPRRHVRALLRTAGARAARVAQGWAGPAQV
jgi:hypothetical protein